MITAYNQYTLLAFFNWHNLALDNRVFGTIQDKKTLADACRKITDMGSCSRLSMVNGINHKSPIVEELVSRGAIVQGVVVLVPGENPEVTVCESLLASLERYVKVNRNRFYSDSKFINFNCLYTWDYIIGSTLIAYWDPEDLEIVKSGNQISAYSKTSWDKRKKRHSKTGGVKVPTGKNVLFALQQSFRTVFPELYEQVPHWTDHHCSNEVRLWSNAIQNSNESIANLRRSLAAAELNLADNLRRLEEAKCTRARILSNTSIPKEEVEAYCDNESHLAITQIALSKVASNPELYSSLGCCLGQYAKDLIDL